MAYDGSDRGSLARSWRRDNISRSPAGAGPVGRLLALAVLLVILAGCGFKTMPVPPQQVVPRAITDLGYQLSERGVTLSWSYPIETVTGEDISEIDSFAIYRAVVPADSYCETCPIPFGQPIILPGGALPGEGRKTATYEATLLRPGNLYFFKVRSRAGWWAESADSNIVSFIWHIPAKAPEGLQAKVEDSRVVLKWEPVGQHLDGSPVTETIRYQVHRSLGGAPFAAVGEPVTGTTFTDTGVINGRKYFYRVQAVSVYDRGMVGGGLSESVAAVPVDRTPPAPPSDVNAIRIDRGVKVFWTPIREKDLQGYRIYRRLEGEQEPTRIGELNAPFSLFTDRNPPKGVNRWYYSVSSIDKSSPANESVRSPEVMVSR